MSNDFSSRLISLRGNKKKAEFARELGIPAPMYHRYENGQVPQYDNLKVISSKTGRSVEWLLTGREDGAVECGRSSLSIELHVAKKCLGKTFHQLAEIMGVEFSLVDSVAYGKSEPTDTLSNAFETKIVPLLESFESSQREQSSISFQMRHALEPLLERLSAIETDVSLIKKLLAKKED